MEKPLVFLFKGMNCAYYQCPHCNGTGLAHCHPNSCKNHHGRACDNVDERGEVGCPPCKFCEGEGRYKLSVTVGENSGSVFGNAGAPTRPLFVGR